MANYEARKFGMHSALAAARAEQLCPQAAFIKPRMERYAAISRQIRSIFEEFTPLIEPLSLDEAYLDVSGSRVLFGPSTAMGRMIKRRIREELWLVALVGVAPNKFVAKIASDLRKPDDFVVMWSTTSSTASCGPWYSTPTSSRFASAITTHSQVHSYVGRRM